MKRFAVIVMTLLLLLPAGAVMAQPEHAPYDLDLSLCYRALTPERQLLFDRIYDGLWEGLTWIELPEKTGYDEVSEIMRLITKDMPEMCAIEGRYSLRYPQNHPEYAIGLNVTQNMSLTAQRDLLDKARELVDELHGSAVEQEMQLHDLLCVRTDYAFGPHCYTAYGALVDGQAVCEGYAKAFALLCRLRGVPCSVVEGTSMDRQGRVVSHAWNQVELDGVTAWVDITWDDQQELMHGYLNLTDEQIGRDHVPDQAQQLSACTDDRYEWHRMRGQLAPAGRGMETLFRAFAQLAAQPGTVSLRFEDEQEFLAIAADIPGCWDAYNAQVPAAQGLYGYLSWITQEPQQVLRLKHDE